MFEGPRLKIKRANQHIRELTSILESFCKSDFCRIGVEADEERGVSMVRMARTRELPGDVPLLLGDAIHNLRSALDLLACDAVRTGGKQPTRYTRFAIEPSREKLAAALDVGALKSARPDLLELILDTVKPYKGGDDELFGLHELDIDDKHKLIVPVLAVVALHNVSVRDADRNVVKIRKLDVDPDGQFRIPESYGKVELARYETASFAALFDKSSAFEGQPIVQTLNLLSKRVAGVVDAIEQTAGGVAQGG